MRGWPWLALPLLLRPLLHLVMPALQENKWWLQRPQKARWWPKWWRGSPRLQNPGMRRRYSPHPGSLCWGAPCPGPSAGGYGCHVWCELWRSQDPSFSVNDTLSRGPWPLLLCLLRLECPPCHLSASCKKQLQHRFLSPRVTQALLPPHPNPTCGVPPTGCVTVPLGRAKQTGTDAWKIKF